MMHAVASKRRLINVISLSFVSKLFSTEVVDQWKVVWSDDSPYASAAKIYFMSGVFESNSIHLDICKKL